MLLIQFYGNISYKFLTFKNQNVANSVPICGEKVFLWLCFMTVKVKDQFGHKSCSTCMERAATLS